MWSLFWCNSAPLSSLQEKLLQFTNQLSCTNVWRLLHICYRFKKSSSTFPRLVAMDGRSLLTEIEKLLHGERRGGELWEMFDMFGRTGQSGVFHDKPDELHYCCRVLRLQMTVTDRSPARLLRGRGRAAAGEEPPPANGKAGLIHEPHWVANEQSRRRDQCVWVLPGRKPTPDWLVPHVYYATFI